MSQNHILVLYYLPVLVYTKSTIYLSVGELLLLDKLPITNVDV